MDLLDKVFLGFAPPVLDLVNITGLGAPRTASPVEQVPENTIDSSINANILQKRFLFEKASINNKK